MASGIRLEIILTNLVGLAPLRLQRRSSPKNAKRTKLVRRYQVRCHNPIARPKVRLYSSALWAASCAFFRYQPSHGTQLLPTPGHTSFSSDAINQISGFFRAVDRYEANYQECIGLGKNERRIGRLAVGNQAMNVVDEEVLKMQGLARRLRQGKRKRKGRAA